MQTLNLTFFHIPTLIYLITVHIDILDSYFVKELMDQFSNQYIKTVKNLSTFEQEVK